MIFMITLQIFLVIELNTSRIILEDKYEAKYATKQTRNKKTLQLLGSNPTLGKN